MCLSRLGSLHRLIKHCLVRIDARVQRNDIGNNRLHSMTSAIRKDKTNLGPVPLVSSPTPLTPTPRFPAPRSLHSALLVRRSFLLIASPRPRMSRRKRASRLIFPDSLLLSINPSHAAVLAAKLPFNRLLHHAVRLPTVAFDASFVPLSLLCDRVGAVCTFTCLSYCTTVSWPFRYRSRSSPWC